MTAKEVKLIQARIKEELKNISALMDELEEKQALIKAERFLDDNFYLRSIGSILHDFYVAVGNTLKLTT